ncbi:MAG: phosphoribosylamine--glycine ligase [Rikenellaceae bacterium]
MNVLLLGSGGREHALAKAIAKSERVANLFIAHGNGGTMSVGTNVDIDTSNFAVIKQFVIGNNIKLVVVGPEEPLVKGIEDFFLNDDEIKYVPVVGPSLDGAKLEGSKKFAKEFMTRHNIPTASFGSFNDKESEKAFQFIDSLKPPYVLKANGLAAGKGVVILDDAQLAKDEFSQMINGKFGQAGKNVVIEEYLHGIELSVFVATDGKNYVVLPSAKDYKRIGEGDTGLNTGGMGAVSPVPFADEQFMAKVEERVIKPTINGFKSEGIRYHGFVFIGLMNVGGDPFVIEYNVRLGDPETEVVIPRIESDIIDLFEGIVYESLDKVEIKISPKHASTVVCVAEGYPEEYRKNDVISLPNNVEQSTIYHAGTKSENGVLYTAGGRVLAVTSLGDTLAEALEKSFETVNQIDYKGKYFRKDIGQDILNYKK